MSSELNARNAPKRRIWPWVLLLFAISLAGVVLLAVRWFSAEFARTKAIAEQHVSVVQKIVESWNMDALFSASGPEMQAQTPPSVAKAYFDDWRSRLGVCRSLVYASHGFHTQSGSGTVVTGNYRGNFENGTAQVVATIRVVDGESRIIGLNIVEIVATSQPADSP